MSWLSKALGNDLDGKYGANSGVEGFDQSVTDYKITYDDDLALKWALRNPAHNLTWGLLRWPGGPFWAWSTPAITIAGKQLVPPLNGYIGWRPNKPEPGVTYTDEQLAELAKRDGVFGIAGPRTGRKYGE
jgi:hypothetical protein